VYFNAFREELLMKLQSIEGEKQRINEKVHNFKEKFDQYRDLQDKKIVCDFLGLTN